MTVFIEMIRPAVVGLVAFSVVIALVMNPPSTAARI
jgi:hypothetical protein